MLRSRNFSQSVDTCLSINGIAAGFLSFQFVSSKKLRAQKRFVECVGSSQAAAVKIFKNSVSTPQQKLRLHGIHQLLLLF
jgi:hypothetical protein